MSFDGGFGAVAFIRSGLINDLVRAIHYRNGDRFVASLSQTIPLAGVNVVASGSLYVEAPRVTLRAADNGARVALTGWARVRLVSGAVDEACIVRLTAEVLVPFAFEEVQENAWSTKLYLNMSQFQVVSAAVAVPWVSAAPGVHAPSLPASAEFRQALLDAVRPMAQNVLRVNVPVQMLDQMQLNLLVQAMVTIPRIRPAAVKVLDDAVALAFDLYSGVERLTTGDANSLELPWDQWAVRVSAQRVTAGRPVAATAGEVQIVVAVSPRVLIEYGGRNLKFQMALRPMAADKRIDDLSLRLDPGAAVLNVALTKINDDPFPDDHARAEVAIVPMHDYLHLLRTEIVYNPSGLAAFLDFFGGLVTEYVRRLATDRISGEIRKANWLFAMAGYHGDVPGLSGPPGLATVSLGHRGTVVDPGHVLVGLQVKVHTVVTSPVYYNQPEWNNIVDNPDVLPGARITQPAERKFPREVPIRARFVTFEIPDHPTLRRDPTIRTKWVVTTQLPDGTRRSLEWDGWSNEAGSRHRPLDLWSPELVASQGLTVQVIHYRPSAVPAAPLDEHEIQVAIADRFRRDIPYVRWHRSVSWNKFENGQPVVDEDGYPVRESKTRMSAVHKTSIVERCKFCDTGSNRPVGAEGMQYFHELPVPAESGFRVETCQYCFRQE